MRSSKSILAGVAAGALVAGVVPLALFASPANAATSTASVSPVRFTAGVTVPNARATFALPMAGTTTVALAVAPTGGTLVVSDDTTVALGTPGTNVTVVNNTDDSYVALKATAAGTYTGSIYNGTDTVSFSFATAGAPTSMTLTPATQTVLVGQAGALTLTLKDAAGNTTQPTTVDTVAVSDNSDDTVSPTTVTATDLADGTHAISLNTTGNAAGTTTVTATPQGTLPSTGVAATTATVTKSGTISTNAVSKLTATTPSNAVNGGTQPSAATASIPEGTTTVTVTIDDTTTAAAGNQVRFAAKLSAGTLNGGSADDTVYTTVTTDSAKKATLTYTIGGAGIVSGASLVVSQVNVVNAAVSPGAKITVTQATPAAQITTSPDDSILAALGTTTNVAVTIKDQFGTALPGYVVRAFRGTSSGTLLTAGTTNASGVATVGVTNASGLASGNSEDYSFTATPPGSSTVAATATNSLTIAYTTSGNVTTMSVAVSGTGSTTFTNSAATVVTAPLLWVPDDTAGVPYGTSAGAFTVASGAQATAASGNLATFTATTTPANNVTVTVPTGLYASATAPTAWNGGTASATVASGAAVYVWGTKVGTHDVTITSGGVTLTGKVKIENRAQDAYNLAITPATSSVAKGSFSTLTVKVTDNWGNPVATTSGAVTVTASGEVLLGGYASSATVTTNAAGEATVTVIAGNSAGAGAVIATPTSAGAPPAWVAGYTKPSTFTTAPVTSAAAAIAVGEGPLTKTITITGSRTTVSGKPGIEVDGITVGFEDGKTVIPYFRFPGETTYTEGTARPVITDDAFMWQRKTGKKFYAYVTSDDGAVQSNRVIIPAN